MPIEDGSRNLSPGSRTVDMGLNEKQALEILQGLDKASKVAYPRDYFESEMDYLKNIGALKAMFQDQVELALGRKVSRRGFILKSIGAVALVSATGLAAVNYPTVLAVYEQIKSLKAAQDELTAERARLEAEAKSLAQRLHDERLEKNNILGLALSIKSANGWEVRYPLLDRNAHYPFSNNKGDSFDIESGKVIVFPERNFNTAVTLTEFVRPSDGISVPKLTVRGDDGIEEWILRDTPTEFIDNRVVVFQSLKEQDTRYLRFARTKVAEKTIYKVRIADRIVLSPDD